MTDPWATTDPYARLALIEQLEPGWNGPRTPATDPTAIACFRAFLDSRSDLPNPDLTPIPTGDGGVEMEWTRGTRISSATCDAGGTMYLHVWDQLSKSDGLDYDGPFDCAAFAAFYESGQLP